MDQLVEVPIGEAGRTFFMEALKKIPGPALELQTAVRAGGAFSAVVPEGTSRARAEDVRAGYLTGLDESIPWLARYLAAIAGSERKGALIVQDLWIGLAELQPSEDLR